MPEEQADDSVRANILAQLVKKPVVKQEPISAEITLPELNLVTVNNDEIKTVNSNVPTTVETQREIPLAIVSEWVIGAIKEGDLKSISAVDCQYLINYLHKKFNSTETIIAQNSVIEKQKIKSNGGSLLERCLEHRSKTAADETIASVSDDDRAKLLETIFTNKNKLVNLFKGNG
jgi:hypothetical protein